jgi:uncharacterized protein
VLTKDLIRARKFDRKSGQPGDPARELRPTFLKNVGSTQEFADELVTLLKARIGAAQGDVKAEALELASGLGIEPVLAKGMLKVCFDAADTEEKDQFPYSEIRTTIFLASTKARAQCSEKESEDEFRKRVWEGLPEAAQRCLDAQELYGDLPEESPLKEFAFENGDSLILRYNVSLAQSVLMYSRQVRIRIPASDRALLRRLWKAFRFFGLIARKGSQTSDGLLNVELEGPLSLHLHSLRYGFSLAHFLPSLLSEAGWQLEAHVQISRTDPELLFLLEPRAELQWKKRIFHQYQPEELSLLEKEVEKKAESAGLRWLPSHDFIALPGEASCFPDFELESVSNPGEKVAVEIFHPWHVSALKARFEQIEKVNWSVPLVLCVSKKAMKNGLRDPLPEAPKGSKTKLISYRETPLVGDILSAAKEGLRLE